MLKRIALGSLLLWLMACSEVDNSTTIISIAALRDIETNNRSVLITQNWAIEAEVVANDEYGEFYKYLVVDDGTAGLKIMCDLDNNYQQYPYGSNVKILCSGLYMVNYSGAVTLGAEPSTDEYTLDYIEGSDVGIYIKSLDSTLDPIAPLEVEFNELTPLHAQRQVKLSEVRISNINGVATFCERDTTTSRTIDTTHTLTDASNQEIELRVEQWCSYADESLPTTSCTIKAIISYYDGNYTATITNMGYQELDN